MFERHLFEHYRLFCNERAMIGDYEGFVTEDGMYITVPCDEIEQESIAEVTNYARHLAAMGETGIPQLVSTINGQMSASIDGQEVFLFKVPENIEMDRLYNEDETIGMKLAHFHNRGKNLAAQTKQQNYLGQWKVFWERRLEQMEQWYDYILRQKKKSPFDESFLLTYPYYMGLTENAIQYVVDSEIDEQNAKFERGTICHKRFTNATWLTLNERTLSNLKLPTTFVYDHPSRDLSEWIRQTVRDDGFQNDKIMTFILDYHNTAPLTKYACRLIYGRLLFPLSYYESVEGYYRSKTDWGKQQYHELYLRVLETEKENTRGLTELSKDLMIPPVDWLI
ncbi:spore coat putative kinase YutH [Anaerobacillus sp. MEB173]|uniref:spore coat putative kinase YutH n=1 Tax=Anaerobacillus sp. MEB173 TaxID=3383345 RepID=UPI003F93E921